jgi:hypothetical protein
VNRLQTLLSDVSTDYGALGGGVHSAKLREIMLEQPEPNEAAAIWQARLLER